MIQPLAPGSTDRTHRIARHGRRLTSPICSIFEFPAHTAAIKRNCDDALILPHRANPAGSDFRERQVATYLKVAWQQIVRAFVTTPIDFGCGCVDPFTVNIEGAQQASLIEAQVRLNSLQCVFAHEKRSLHRTIVPPKPNSAPRRIISAALIWKTKRHQSHIAWSISPAWLTLSPH